MNEIEIRDLRNGEYAYIHKIVIDDYGEELGSTGIAIYIALAYFANYNTQELRPNQITVAKKAQCSRSQVSKKLKLMEKLGLIQKEKRDRYHCVYYLLKASCRCGKHLNSKWKSDSLPSGSDQVAAKRQPSDGRVTGSCPSGVHYRNSDVYPGNSDVAGDDTERRIKKEEYRKNNDLSFLKDLVDAHKRKKTKLKPYYKDEEMRWSQNQWWVIPEDGGPWREFADREDKIEWKYPPTPKLKNL